ncbi:MAG: MotA/TolQ/ExbB proton channel family protein [Planctomycetota bacterium]
MDLGTIIGVVLGFVLIIGAILMGDSLGAYIDIPSMIIVIGGCIAALLTAFPMGSIFKLPVVLGQAIKSNGADIHEMIQEMVSYAEVARRDGILALESKTAEMSDDLLILGIKMAVDGTDPELIEQILEADVENMSERHGTNRGMFDAAGRYAPAFGMIGTLIGLVAMLANMEDPSAIGAGMAAALLTTMYGAIVANVLFMPLADKLKLRNDEEVMRKSIILKGVMAIQAGDNPRVVEQKLKSFLPPKLRGSEDDAQAA